MTATPDFSGPWSGDEALPRAFAEIALRVYAGDPKWLPEDPLQLGYLFSRQHPYFLFGKVWAGWRNGEARLAGFYNPALTIDGERVAFFGFWETIDAAAPNQALFNDFEAWAKTQGATTVYGPINFNTYGLYRIRTSHFGEPCFQGEPYNPAHYPPLLESLGYTVAHRYFSTFEHDLEAVRRGMEVPYQACLPKMGDNIELLPLTPDFWMERLERIYQLSEQVFQSNFAYTPINLDIFKALCGRSFINKAHPTASVVAIDKARDDIAAMLICFPSWGPLINQGATDRVHPSAIDYAVHADRLPRPRMALAKTAGTDPRYRGMGIYSVMMYRLVEAAIETGFDHYGAVLFKEDNLSAGMARKASIERAYALYRKSIA